MPNRSRRAASSATVVVPLFLVAMFLASAMPARRVLADANGTWQFLGDPTPGPLRGMAYVYDPVRGRTILFCGGADAVFANRTFALTLDGSGVHWAQATGPVAPPARTDASLVYDSARDRVLLVNAGSPGGDIWVLALSTLTWTHFVPAGAGPNRTGESVIYDPVRDRVLVFGGFDGSFYANDLWQLTLSGTPTWTALSPSGTPPSPRARCATAYDPVRDQMVTFGGTADVNGFVPPTNEAWTLSLAGTPTWTLLAPAGTPPAPRTYGAMFYDPAQDRMITFGGSVSAGVEANDTWALSLGGGGAWTQLSPAGAPPVVRAQFALVYDPSSARGILLGGQGPRSTLSDVWALSLGVSPAWIPFGDIMGPGFRESATGVYDPLRHRFVEFGGLNSSRGGLNDMFTIPVTPGGTWSRIGVDSPTRPDAGVDAVVAFDAGRDRLVVFPGDYGNQVWIFDNASQTWSQLATSGTPPSGRSGMRGFYDAARDRLVLFGGEDQSGVLLNDVWELDFQPSPAWQPIVTSGQPPTGRVLASVVYDAARDRMLVFGGGPVGGGGSSDLWQLSFGGSPHWTQLSPWGAIPSGRQGATAVVDATRHRMVIFGGRTGTGSTFDPDTYTLDLLADPPGWTLLAPTYDVAGPSPRGLVAAAYDPVNDRLLVQGGRGVDAMDVTRGHTLDGAFALTWGEAATPTVVSFAGEQAEPGLVRLTWFTPAGAGQGAVAYRSTDGASWDVVAHLVSDGSGRFVLADRVPSGGRYDYRLGIAGAAGEELTADHWVTIPAGVAFGITSAGPNPSQGALTVSIALASDRPAVLELLDVAGRRVLRRDLTSPAPGISTVDLAQGRRLAPGVYLLKLEQEGRSALEKVVVVR